ncbi:meiosis protein SPO22/ZIP4 like-domain-containing protein [Auriculariales sp. MPI-PUGE-AT-0066]|nr:meiosis protein SPO22/ZIP4 like-domain-containing protein [Auriculariales sp. MPI-PUGE-AT-0066]
MPSDESSPRAAGAGGLSKTAEERKRIFEDISDILLRIKPRLSEPASVLGSAIVQDLEKLAGYAESLQRIRPKPGTKAAQAWQESSDTLDREGVNLWNVSSLLRSAAQDAKPLLGALRLSGFRLILAGIETNPEVSGLAHVLRLASKTAAALTDAGRTDAAMELLSDAVQYDDLLRQTVASDSLVEQRASATVEFLSARMVTAWKQKNESVAYFMLQKITESDDDRLAHIAPRDRQQLAGKVLEIGRSLLANVTMSVAAGRVSAEGKQAQEAVRWLQKAFGLVESIETLPNVLDLRRSILRSLSRAYYAASNYDPENLTRAEVSLQELMTSVDPNEDVRQEEYQELRWMRLALLRRKKAPEHMIQEAFCSAIEHASWTESGVADILQELRTLSNQPTLVTNITQSCLAHALNADNGRPFVDRIALSLIFHCAKDGEHTRAVQELETAFGSIANQPAFELTKVATMACQSLLWQFGDRLYASKKFANAADWYILAANPAFRIMAFVNNVKCFRKAALCHIQQGEYAQASALIRRCPGTDAATYYIVFLAAAHQGLESEASRAVNEMISAPGYNRDMLLQAVQLAHERDLKTLLVSVLQALLKDVRSQKGSDNEVEAITLTRCIIRLVIELLMQPSADLQHLAKTLVEHFDTAQTLIAAASVKKTSALISKDVAWLWRAAFNTAMQGCRDWQNCELHIANLFEAASELMALDCATSILEPDAELRIQLAYASFSAITARVYSARALRNTGTEQIGLQRHIVKDITRFRQHVASLGALSLPTDSGQEERLAAMSQLAVVFEVEALVTLCDWDALPLAINMAAALPQTARLRTYDSIADMVWPLTDCPADVQYASLEVPRPRTQASRPPSNVANKPLAQAVLRASLDAGSLSVQKFSRWLRAICTWLLIRNAIADRSKALSYIDQSLEVMRDDHENSYPVDEKQWLLATTYNTGLQCHCASHLDESKRWFENAIRLCKFIPGAEDRAQKIADTYRQLLERYGRQQAQD